MLTEKETRQLYRQCNRDYVTDADRKLADSFAIGPRRPSRTWWITTWQFQSTEVYKTKFQEAVRIVRMRGAARDAFFAANPHVKERRKQPLVRCVHTLRTGWECPTVGRIGPNCKELINDVYADHGTFFKAWSHPNGIFLVGHPYEPAQPEKYPDHVLPEGFQEICLGKDYSWYYPGRTHVSIVGRPDVLDTLTDDYPNPEVGEGTDI